VFTLTVCGLVIVCVINCNQILGQQPDYKHRARNVQDDDVARVVEAE